MERAVHLLSFRARGRALEVVPTYVQPYSNFFLFLIFLILVLASKLPKYIPFLSNPPPPLLPTKKRLPTPAARLGKKNEASCGSSLLVQHVSIQFYTLQCYLKTTSSPPPPFPQRQIKYSFTIFIHVDISKFLLHFPSR